MEETDLQYVAMFDDCNSTAAPAWRIVDTHAEPGKGRLIASVNPADYESGLKAEGSAKGLAHILNGGR